MVRLIRGTLGPGIQFETASGEYDGLIYWTFSPAQVLATFARFGWPVE